jgi:hypothetical protein
MRLVKLSGARSIQASEDEASDLVIDTFLDRYIITNVDVLRLVYCCQILIFA